MKHQRFVFEGYEFDPADRELRFNYSLDGQINFTERFWFDFDYVDYDERLLDRALQNLFLLAGVSYYKTYLPPLIEIRGAQVDQPMADFLAKTYQRGLGEFFYVNQLDPNHQIKFPTTTERIEPVEVPANSGILVAIGGGKDSLVSVELLRDQSKVATWSVEHGELLKPLEERIGLKHYSVRRQWDQQLLQLNQAGAYNGHIPLSAIWAAVGTVVAVLAGYQDVVVSNENSANEPTLHYQGVAINHQYSKSLEFEQLYQQVITATLGDAIRYYSFLRPLSEVRIAEIFARVGFDQYAGVFSSCNKVFAAGNQKIFWDGKCAKCAFVFLALTPFVQRKKLEQLFGDKNLLLDPELTEMYQKLLGIAGEKPLDCIGEVKESRQAMRLAQQIYPELERYQFELPKSYDYKALASDSMPQELHEHLVQKIKQLGCDNHQNKSLTLIN